MSLQQKERDYLFDNYKVLLVLLVVIGHFIELSYRNNEFLYQMKWMIVSFHMPAFIFISGYFSKRELPILKLVQKLLVPYIVYEIIYYLLYVYVIDKPTELYLLHPKFSLWYILALFMWRLATPFVKKIPHHMILAILAGLFIGCSDMSDNFLSIMVQIAAKYAKCRIPFLEVFHIFIQYLYSHISFCRSHCHILTISNLEYHFMKQLFLFALSYFFIIICNLPVLSFPNIVSLHSIVK